MNKVIACFILAAVICSGCASHDGRPAQAYLKVSPEYKLKSAKHWRVVANDITANIQKAVKASDVQVHVPLPAEPASIFSRVFASQLRSSLFDSALVVTPFEAGAHSVTVTVDAVRHVTLASYTPASLVLLAVGVKVLRDIQNSGHREFGQIATAGSADAALTYRDESRRPSLEVVLTTAVMYQGRYVFHSTDTYYVDGVDACLFNARVSQCDA
jgi:hypothetical protein